MHKSDFIEKSSLVIVLTILITFVYSQFASDTPLADNNSNSIYIYLAIIMGIYIVIFLFIKSTWRIKPSLTTQLILMWIVWEILTGLVWGTHYSFQEYIKIQLICVCLWPLIYLYFYEICSKNLSLEKLLVAYFSLIAIFFSIMFILSYQISSVSGFYAQLNIIYYPLLLLPWIMLQKKIIWRYIGIFGICILVFYSMKRTAIISLSLSLMTYIYVRQAIENKIKNKIVLILFSIVLIVLIIISFNFIDEANNNTFTKRLESDSIAEGSGRPYIYKDTLFKIMNSTPVDVLIGHGFNAVSMDSTNNLSAHNDWLEVQYDYGIGGLFIYSLLHLSLIKKVRKLIAETSVYAAPLMASYMLFFGMSLTSHLIIYPNYFFFLAAFWGMIFAHTKENTNSCFSISA